MTSKLRVGIIGSGGIASVHLRGYLDSGRYEIVGLADLEESAMAEKDTLFHIAPRHYSDARAMLAAEQPDVVSICTWHPGHAPWTIAAAAYHPKAILCEKPMADTLGHAEQMLIACQRNRVKLGIAHQRRFVPAYTLARDLIAQGAIGKVQIIQSFASDGLPNYAPTRPICIAICLAMMIVIGSWAMSSVKPTAMSVVRGLRIALLESSTLPVVPWQCC